MTDQDIFERLRAILIETFDIDAERITPQARLYEDLDIDSIDAVDLIVRLKPLVGKRLQPEAFKAVRTLQDVINALQGLMQPEAGAAASDKLEGATAS
ncbi:acyl carrier protein [Roseateles terrae]|uniref:Acyl carrier protein n=1 Tax=Roseateles terrae TaxID=431060 RepID=A0ABR6GSM5_9BURK|nr:acyl carrier protein [Roseateles terrae]MBB3194234.1 acyl carrier protein [Roseateles terrae]OWQ88079.1 acyl carrier protein [Roseateles terrae]